MRGLWHDRLARHQKEQFKYLQLVFNDHFVLIMIILFGGLLYGYSRLVRQLAPSWWLPVVIAVVLTGCGLLGRLATLAEEADATFLLPQTTAFSRYLFKARRYSFVLPGTLLVLATLACYPLLGVMHRGAWPAALTLGLAVLLFKDADLWLQLLSLYPHRAPRWVSRWLLALGEFVAIMAGVWLHPAVTMIVALAIDLLLRWRISDWFTPASLDWLRLIKVEDDRMGRLYRFYNLFTDVPGLQGSVRRRKYLDFLTHFVTRSHAHTWAYLYLRGLLRRTEYSGLVVRLAVIGAVVLALVQPWWLVLLLTVGLSYIVGFQLLPFYFVYDELVFTRLYPLPAESRLRSFSHLVLAVLLLVAVVLAIGPLVMGAWVNAGVTLLSGVAMAIVFSRLYVPYRIQRSERVTA